MPAFSAQATPRLTSPTKCSSNASIPTDHLSRTTALLLRPTSKQKKTRDNVNCFKAKCRKTTVVLAMAPTRLKTSVAIPATTSLPPIRRNGGTKTQSTPSQSSKLMHTSHKVTLKCLGCQHAFIFHNCYFCRCVGASERGEGRTSLRK